MISNCYSYSNIRTTALTSKVKQLLVHSLEKEEKWKECSVSLLGFPKLAEKQDHTELCKKEGSHRWFGMLHFQHEKGGKQGQNLLLGEQERHYAHGEFVLLKFVCDVLCITCGDDNKRKGLAKSLGWPGEPLVFIHGHVSLLRVFQGKNPAWASIWECRHSINRCIMPKLWRSAERLQINFLLELETGDKEHGLKKLIL